MCLWLSMKMTKYDFTKLKTHFKWRHYTSPKQNGIHYAPPKQNGIHNQPVETSIAFFKDMIYFWFQKKNNIRDQADRVIKEGFFLSLFVRDFNIRFNNNPSNVFHPNSFKTLPGNMQSSSSLLVLMIKPSPFFTVLAYTISLQAFFSTRIASSSLLFMIQ